MRKTEKEQKKIKIRAKVNFPIIHDYDFYCLKFETSHGTASK